jgi:predicted small metal-binding protein
MLPCGSLVDGDEYHTRWGCDVPELLLDLLEHSDVLS